ncbi:zf-HC2 domain-containing protein [Streptomyces albipurpureus]|uniref:Zf-HC2 domain-containing protein n=1 Tax=Streptomyces albipurpureus TaxID=2897419 RepID=A0ABT0UHT1_9ACTN|nr:zf-HC2 domain-containing protein [Streptomyces sp. CWNU-1]MCM2388008.1 zf-HC2 domain-containing protein [Streptomyces sp. CWNU-1]
MSHGQGRHHADWHVDEQQARRYADGSAPEPDAWSLETHIESCGPCAARVSASVLRGAAGPVLDQVRMAVLAQATAAPTRVPWTARMVWAAGPALRGAWLLAVVLTAGGALGLAYGMDLAWAHPLLLALAPALPLAGVALSYGRHADPLYEIVAATPSGGLRLLLTRTAAVLAVSVPLLTAAGALMPRAGDSPRVPGAAAWLLPGLALTVATLALGSYIGCRLAAGALGAGWLAVVLLPALPALPQGLGEQLSQLVTGPGVQGGWAAAAVVCGGLLAVRRSSFDHMERL